MRHHEIIWKYRGKSLERKNCFASGKNVYDKKGAQSEANRRWNEDHVELRIYPCPSCSGWHLTKRL